MSWLATCYVNVFFFANISRQNVEETNEKEKIWKKKIEPNHYKLSVD